MSTSNYYRAPGMPQDESLDHSVTATALDGHVRAIGIRATATVAKALEIHNTSPVATAAFGRFITGSLLVADNMKGENDTQTSVIKCDGPIKGMTCVCDSFGNCRAYVTNPIVENSGDGKGLDIASCVGNGILTIIRDIGLKEPYVGSVELISGAIAEDFTYYMAKSEQTPSVIALGVGLDSSGVTNAGGIMVQMLPGATPEDIDYIEKRANGGFPDVSYLLSEGLSPAQIVDMFLGDPEIKFLSSKEIAYKCNCSQDKMLRVLSTLGSDDLDELASTKEGIEIKCHFCAKKYEFTSDQVLSIGRSKEK